MSCRLAEQQVQQAVKHSRAAQQYRPADIRITDTAHQAIRSTGQQPQRQQKPRQTAGQQPEQRRQPPRPYLLAEGAQRHDDPRADAAQRMGQHRQQEYHHRIGRTADSAQAEPQPPQRRSRQCGGGHQQ